jgi:hypothetical protein
MACLVGTLTDVLFTRLRLLKVLNKSRQRPDINSNSHAILAFLSDRKIAAKKYVFTGPYLKPLRTAVNTNCHACDTLV